MDLTDFSATRALFDLPEGIVYLDGNSLGPVPSRALERAEMVIRDEWGGQLIRAWNTAGWMDQPRRVGDRIARLIGAPSGSVGSRISIASNVIAIAITASLKKTMRSRPNSSAIGDLVRAANMIRLLLLVICDS